MSSFHGQTITTTVNKLIKAIGEPMYVDNSGEDKSNYDFSFMVQDFEVFVYDWKEYRPIGPNELIDFHIGTDTPMQSLIAKEELENLLN
jgi:hypothetical protein